MQDLSRWDEWWDESPPQHDAHYWAAVATLHQAHVRAYQDKLSDKFWEKLGFRRVTNWGTAQGEPKAQPMFKHIPNLPILERKAP